MIPEQIPVLGGRGLPQKGRTQRHSGSSDQDLFHIPLRASPKADPSRIPSPGSKAEAASPLAAPGERNSRLQALGSLRLNGLDLFADLLQRPPVQHALPQHHERRRRHGHGQSGAHEAPEPLSLQRGRTAAVGHSPGECPVLREGRAPIPQEFPALIPREGRAPIPR